MFFQLYTARFHVIIKQKVFEEERGNDMNKIINILLCASILLGTSACGKNTADDTEFTVVSYWMSNGHDKVFLTEETEKWNDTVGKEKGIRIDYSVRTYDEIVNAVMRGEGPDIFGASLYDFMPSDKLVALEEINGGAEILERFKPYIDESRHKYNGKTYTVPVSTTTYGLIYNKEMFKAAGIVDENGEAKPPETFSQFIEDAKLLTNPKKGEYGFIFPGQFESLYNDDVLKFASASCGFMDGYNPADGKYDYSAVIEVMKGLLLLKQNGSCYPGSEKLDNDAARARFGEGKIGMKTAGAYDYGVLKYQFPAKADWGVAPFPVLDGWEPGWQYMGNEGTVLISNKGVKRLGTDKLMTVYNWIIGEKLAIKEYKAGLSIPMERDLIKGVTLDDGMEQWQSFVDISEISKPCPMAHKVETTEVLPLRTLWASDILTGKIKMSVLEKEIMKMQDWENNIGMAEYEKQHPEYNPLAAIVPGRSCKR